jgi:hypothetical protein
MLITLLLWAYLLALGWLYGRLILHLLSRNFHLDDETSSFALTWLAGMAAISTLATFLSLFIKLALTAQLITLAGGLLILIWLWRTSRLKFSLPKWHPLGIVLGALILLTALEISTHTPGNPDTGLYHAQTIRWIETFPAVPGLGNLHSRLAYNSSWLTLNALFSFAFLSDQSYHTLPGLIVLAVCAQLLHRGLRLLKSLSLRESREASDRGNPRHKNNSPSVSPILQPHRKMGEARRGCFTLSGMIFATLPSTTTYK